MSKDWFQRGVKIMIVGERKQSICRIQDSQRTRGKFLQKMRCLKQWVSPLTIENHENTKVNGSRPSENKARHLATQLWPESRLPVWAMWISRQQQWCLPQAVEVVLSRSVPVLGLTLIHDLGHQFSNWIRHVFEGPWKDPRSWGLG